MQCLICLDNIAVIINEIIYQRQDFVNDVCKDCKICLCQKCYININKECPVCIRNNENDTIMIDENSNILPVLSLKNKDLPFDKVKEYYKCSINGILLNAIENNYHHIILDIINIGANELYYALKQAIYLEYIEILEILINKIDFLPKELLEMITGLCNYRISNLIINRFVDTLKN